MGGLVRLATVLLFAASILWTAPGNAQSTVRSDAEVDKALDENVGDHAQVHRVFSTLQHAVAIHDASAVAALVDYPLKAKVKGRPVILRTPQAFVSHYDGIVTSEIVEAVAKQQFSELFVNSQGAMFGDGQVWLAGICRDKACKHTDIKIRTIQSTADSR